MAQPPAYNREHDFTLDENSDLNTSSLNKEFDNASESINKIRENLAILQNDDGSLRADVVKGDAVGKELTKEIEKLITEATSNADSAVKKSSEAVKTVNQAFDDLQEEATAQIQDVRKEGQGWVSEIKPYGEAAVTIAPLTDQLNKVADNIETIKNAGFAYRYHERIEAEGTGDLAALHPSVNVHVGDHVMNIKGQLFEIIELTEYTFTVGFEVTSLKGPKGDVGSGLEPTDAFNSTDELLATYPIGSTGQTVLVGGSVYAWSDTLNQWVKQGDLHIEDKPPTEIEWDNVLNKPALLSYDEMAGQGPTLKIDGMTYVELP